MMGGKIWVESEPSIGSSFGVSLVLGVDHPAPACTRAALPEGIKNILLISDHLISRGILSRRLQALNAQVATATTGAVALRQVAGNCPDMVLVDQDLSKGSVPELLAALQAQAPGLPVVMLCSDLREAKGALQEGLLFAALPKPLLWRDLVQVLAPEVVVPPDIAVLAPELSQTSQARRLRVLYAEDNRTNRIVFEKFLKPLDIELHFAEDGREAVEKFLELRPDIVFMDVSMPRMDGREATRHIRSMPEGRETPIIALTAHALQEEIERILAAGMNAMLTKPLRKAELLQALQDHAPVGIDLVPDQLSRKKTRESGRDSSEE